MKNVKFFDSSLFVFISYELTTKILIVNDFHLIISDSFFIETDKKSHYYIYHSYPLQELFW